MRRALVLGLARSGEAARSALEARGTDVVAADRKLGNDADLSLLDGVEVLVKSPGVPGAAPLVAAARSRGIPVWSEVELGARLLRGHPLVAVTGTKGKTTTSELLGHILGAPVAGNVGRPLTGLAGEVESGVPIVCEVSSFQLEDVHEFAPAVAILLNLGSDHLDRHGTLEAYHAAKLRIFENQGPGDVAVVPRGFGPVPGQALSIEFSAQDAVPGELRLPGAHNRANAAAAVAAARALGADEETIAAGVSSFAGVPHRLEPVGEILGVRYVNDSIATNTMAVRSALAAFDEPLHLILGGRPKGEAFEVLAQETARANVAGAYLIGEAAEALAVELERVGVPFRRAGTLDRAVAEAAAAARAGELVLLSPACASYDQFDDFEQRGEEFRRLVENLEP